VRHRSRQWGIWAAAAVLLCGPAWARAAEDESVARHRKVAEAAGGVIESAAAREDKSLLRTVAVAGKQSKTFFGFLAKRLPRIARFGKFAGGLSGASSLLLMGYGVHELRQAVKEFGFHPDGGDERGEAYKDIAYGAGGAARMATIIGVSMTDALHAAGSLQSAAGIGETIAGYRQRDATTGKRNAELITLGALDTLSGLTINASAWTGKPWLLVVAGGLTGLRTGIEHRKTIVNAVRQLPSRARALKARLIRPIQRRRADKIHQ